MTKRHSKKHFLTACIPWAVMVVLTICTMSESSAQSQVACELTKMNVVYVGVDNPVLIAASDYSVNDLEMAITNGQINGIAGKYIIRPAKPGKVELTIKADGKVLGTRTFRALQTPDPQACAVLKADGKEKCIRKGEITLKQLLAIDRVHADIHDFLFDVQFKVVEFTVNVSRDDGLIVIEKSASNLVTEQQKKLFKTMNSGQKVLFEDIKAMSPDGSVRDLNDIVLKVL